MNKNQNYIEEFVASNENPVYTFSHFIPIHKRANNITDKNVEWNIIDGAKD